MNRYEEESNEARQITLCRMLKNNEIHSFKHVLLKYIRKVFLVYYAIKIMTTCLYNEVKMKVIQNRKFYKNVTFIYSKTSNNDQEASLLDFAISKTFKAL